LFFLLKLKSFLGDKKQFLAMIDSGLTNLPGSFIVDKKQFLAMIDSGLTNMPGSFIDRFKMC